MTTKLNKMIKGAALVGAMAFGLMLSTSTTASAQNRGWDRDDRYRQQNYDRDRDGDRNRGNTQAAYTRGYNDGLRAGEQAARYGRNGYNEYRNYGGNGYMQQSYQSGYNRGYQDGVNRYRGRRSGITLRFPW